MILQDQDHDFAGLSMIYHSHYLEIPLASPILSNGQAYLSSVPKRPLIYDSSIAFQASFQEFLNDLKPHM